MQWKGRKFAFILCSCIVIFGWVITYFAKSVTSILIGESLHGIGGNSLIVVSLVTISEMVEPRFRSTSLILFGVIQCTGAVIVTFFGYFLNWRTVCIVMSMPSIISLILVLTWPESPSWLACKGKFSECEEAFIKLRGTGKESIKELNELIKAQKEALADVALKSKKNALKDFVVKIRRRDFYVPNFHSTIILFTYYWSGPLVIFTYVIDIISTTAKASDYAILYMDATIVTASILAVILIQYFKNKSLLLTSFSGSIIFLLLSATVIYFKDFNIFPKEILLFCIIGYLFLCAAASAHQSFAVATEVIPVKHRGIGGTLYIISTCLYHSVSLKVAPYLFKLIGVSGTFVVFSLITILGSLFIWRFVPETKGRTLQEIEDYYNKGSFIVEDRDDKILEVNKT